MNSVTMALRLILRRPVQAIQIILVVAVVTALATLFHHAREQFEVSVRESTTRAYGGKQFALEVLDPSAQRTIESAAGFDPVWTNQHAVGTNTLEVQAEQTSTRLDGPAVTDIVTGKRPSSASEVAVSATLAKLLDLKIGSVFTEFDGCRCALRVVATSVDPADSASLRYFKLATGDAGSPTYWVSDTSPFESVAIRPLLDRGLVTAQTVSNFATERADAETNRVFGALRFADKAFVNLGGVLAGWLLAVSAWRLRRDRAHLRSLGLSRRREMIFLSTAGASCVVIGVLLGATVALLTSPILGISVSEHLGQHWGTDGVAITQIATTSISIFAVTLGIAALIVTLGDWARNAGRDRRYREGNLRWQRLAWSGLLVAAVSCGVLLAVRQHFGADVEPVGLTLSTVAGVLLILLVVANLWRRGTAVTSKRVVPAISSAFVPLALVVAATSFFATFQSAADVNIALTERETAVRDQPRGSYLVNGIGVLAAEQLARRFRDVGGGRADVYIYPEEADRTLRVTAPQTAHCIEQSSAKLFRDVPDRCYSVQARTTTNVVVFSHELAGQRMLGDNELVAGSHIGLIDIAVPSGRVKKMDPLRVEKVTDQLGGHLPGLVVGMNSDWADSVNLRPSNIALVHMHEFDTLSDSARATLRSEVRRSAGAGQVSEDAVPPEVQQRLLTGYTSSFVPSASLILIGSFAGAILAGGQRQLLLALAELGMSRRRQRGLAFRVMLLVLFSAVILPAFAYLLAWQLSGGDSLRGIAWLAAPISGVGVWLICCTILARSR